MVSLSTFFVHVFYAGYVWMTSRGNEQAVTEAKETIRTSIIGILVVLSAFMITNFVFNQLGKIAKFRRKSFEFKDDDVGGNIFNIVYDIVQGTSQQMYIFAVNGSNKSFVSLMENHVTNLIGIVFQIVN